MKLTSKKIVDILKEEYDKRIQHCLNEFEELVDDKGNDRFEDGQGLKVYGPDRTEFTLGGSKEINGVKYKILYKEYVPRIDKKDFQSSTQLDEDELYGKKNRMKDLQDFSKNKLLDDNSLQGKDYILVSDEDFKKYFTN